MGKWRREAHIKRKEGRKKQRNQENMKVRLAGGG